MAPGMGWTFSAPWRCMTAHLGKFALQLTICRSGMSGHFWLLHYGPSFKLLQRHRLGCVFDFHEIQIGSISSRAAQQHDPGYEMEWTYFLMTKHLPNPEAKIQPLTYWTKHPQIILWFGLGLTWMLPCHVQADEKHLQWQKESRDNESCLLVVEYDLRCEDLNFPGCSCAPPAIQQIVLIILQGMHGLTFLPICNRDVVLYRHYVSIIFYR